MEENVIKIKNLAKKYQLGEIGVTSVGETFNRFFSRSKRKDNEEVWALKAVDISIKRGEIVGLIGRNGAGKSTLLKLISKITAPTCGEIEIKGNLGALLEVGTGFHPDLTGKENIFLNGAILGMARSQIEKNLKSIIDFSGVGKFIDTPVKRYSSGMKVRLGFAVASHLDTDILIIDEVLAVGDIDFQKKCIGKIDQITRSKERTIIIVSHNLDLIEKLCARSIFLKDGEVYAEGKTREVLDKYIETFSKGEEVGALNDIPRSGELGIEARALDFCIRNSKDSASTVLKFGEPFEIDFNFVSMKDLNEVSAVVGIETLTGTRVITSDSSEVDVFFSLKSGESKKVTLSLPTVVLNPGKYRFVFGLRRGRAGLDQVVSESFITVSEISFDNRFNYTGTWGVVYGQGQWK